MIYFVVFYISVLIYVVKKSDNKCLLSPIFWLAFSWILLFGIYYFSGIEYNYKLKPDGFLYLLIQLSLFCLFYLIGKKNKKRMTTFPRIIESKDKLGRISIETLFCFCFIAWIIWLVDVFRLNNIIFGKRIEDFNISIIGVFADLFMSLSLLVWLFSLYRNFVLNKKNKWYVYMSAIIFLTPAVITAGRQPVMIFLISTLISFLSLKTKKKVNMKKPKIRNTKIIAIVCLIFTYLLFISSTRDIGDHFEDKVALLEYTTNCTITEDSVKFLNLLGPLRNITLDYESYYSHQVSMFQVFYDNYHGPLYYGSVQFGYISRRFPTAWGLNKEAAYDYLEQIAMQTNTYSHVWRTIFGEYVLDFGRFGATVFFSINGYFCGKAKKNYNDNRNVYTFIRLILMCIFAFFTVQASPWAETSWAYPFYWLTLILLIKPKKEYSKVDRFHYTKEL